MPTHRRRPLIGVTGPSRRLAPGRIAACALVRLAGGRPRLLAPNRGSPPEDLDALVITGGSDIDPMLYGQPGGPWVAPDPVRDEFELAALEFATRRRLPILGICRGAQLINVAAGGTLHGDVTNLRRVTSNRPSLLPRKRVELVRDSRLCGLLGRTELRVNSLHHQAVKDLGRDLRVVARDGDGLVQAIESERARFLIGVQWHPEYLGWQALQRRLFTGLAAATGE